MFRQSSLRAFGRPMWAWPIRTPVTSLPAVMASFPSRSGKLAGWACLLTLLASGCRIALNVGESPRSEARLDLADPVLNQRRVFVVAEITPATAAETIRQLLYLDAGGPQPIQLLLMTPGGDLQAAFAVVRTMQTLRSPVNTIALGTSSGCRCSSG